MSCNYCTDDYETFFGEASQINPSALKLRNLSQNEAFYVETVEENEVTLRMKDGRYQGIEDDRKDGTRVKAVSEPYSWIIYKDNKEADVFSNIFEAKNLKTE